MYGTYIHTYCTVTTYISCFQMQVSCNSCALYKHTSMILHFSYLKWPHYPLGILSFSQLMAWFTYNNEIIVFLRTDRSHISDTMTSNCMCLWHRTEHMSPPPPRVVHIICHRSVQSPSACSQGTSQLRPPYIHAHYMYTTYLYTTCALHTCTLHVHYVHTCTLHTYMLSMKSGRHQVQ